MKVKIGDIVTLTRQGIRRLVVDSRDEIVPCNNKWGIASNRYKMLTVYRLAGDEYKNRWFSASEVVSVIQR